MKLYYLSFLFLISFFVACEAKQKEKTVYNIIVFLVDDMSQTNIHRKSLIRTKKYCFFGLTKSFNSYIKK